MYGDKKGNRVGGREAGRMAGGGPEGISMQENLTQCVEHHRQTKRRVWGEVTQFDVSVVPLEGERRARDSSWFPLPPQSREFSKYALNGYMNFSKGRWLEARPTEARS